MSKTTIPSRLRKLIRAQGQYRCGYCRSAETVTGISLEIEHLIPEAAGGASDEKNLWLACVTCNKIKSAQTHGRDPVSGRRVRLFNPRTQSWKEHFAWSADGTEIIGKTSCGRATIIALQLNRLQLVIARRHWVTADLHPPKD